MNLTFVNNLVTCDVHLSAVINRSSLSNLPWFLCTYLNINSMVLLQNRNNLYYKMIIQQLALSYCNTNIPLIQNRREYFLFPKVTHSCIAFWPGIPYHQFRKTWNDPFPQIHATTTNSWSVVPFKSNSQHPIPGHSCLFRNYQYFMDG